MWQMYSSITVLYASCLAGSFMMLLSMACSRGSATVVTPFDCGWMLAAIHEDVDVGVQDVGCSVKTITKWTNSMTLSKLVAWGSGQWRSAARIHLDAALWCCVTSPDAGWSFLTDRSLCFEAA
ncbi:Protein sidekick-1 [Trichinella spiralis]|uniref:Protein sidekick-1 n=1 Tax=Trichinella spiralis TaxID=6334 RepID=A0ABR3KWC1_TRISP